MREREAETPSQQGGSSGLWEDGTGEGAMMMRGDEGTSLAAALE